MAPLDRSQARVLVERKVSAGGVVIFSKSFCRFCSRVKDLFTELGVQYDVVELDETENGSALQEALLDFTGQNTVPNVFVNKTHVGGCDSTFQAHENGRLAQLLAEVPQSDQSTSYDYDLIVVGGGSGGLAASKEASTFGKKVLVLDFVVPTPLGTTWGLGGTCVNVGCIPKKLMHQAALLAHGMDDARSFGWEFGDQVKHNWETMKNAIQDYIHSLNFGYRVALRTKTVTYDNALAKFIGPHTIKATNKQGVESTHTAKTFILAMGERPRYLGIPGDKEYCITSDDLFSLPYCPGETLVVGASYVALECAGFLSSLGLSVTVMIRSILLRGFDQQLADLVGDFMGDHCGIKFVRKFVPTKVEQLEAGTPGRLRVFAKSTEGEETYTGEFNTVVVAVGRDACTRNIGLDTVGIKVNAKTGKIPVDEYERTNVPHVYAIGDIQEGRLQLTPVAIQAGLLLAQRLYGGSTVKCDYLTVPTTIFTPLEYGCCGLSEERALTMYGDDNLEVYHSNFKPLEWVLPQRESTQCYAKIICHKQENERIVGFHFLGPNAGEVTQGFAVAMKCGLTKTTLDSTIGIHPTCAEIFTTLTITKRSGQTIETEGC
uniref:Thioredoxin reductase 1, cytoplasmic n=1 Tax=Eptatretus burgeri TaxID=7764 RepID=A0A8C4Q2G5_EPTBU